MKDENDKSEKIEKELKKDFDEQLEQRKKIEAIRVETVSRLKKDPEALAFLEPYSEGYGKIFLDSYGNDKGLWYVFKDEYREEQEKRALQFLEVAKAGLECLQKKKLYDFRREWGAGSIDLPDMKTPFDFMLKADDVFALNWIPPINEGEVALLKEYVAQYSGEDLSYFLTYEANNFSFPFICGEGRSEGREGSFFEFYDKKTGSTLHALPDKRGKRAQFYLLEYNRIKKEEEDAKVAKGEMEPTPEMDLKPFSPDDETAFLEEFIKKFDTKETWNHYLAYKNYHNPLGEKEDDGQYILPIKDRINSVYRKLGKLDVVLPVKANQDWRLGLIEAWGEYERKNVLEALDQAFEEYLFHVESGIQFMSKEPKQSTLNVVNILMEKMVKGRELLGESGEMDFR